jgi:hypothetical protein
LAVGSAVELVVLAELVALPPEAVPDAAEDDDELPLPHPAKARAPMQQRMANGRSNGKDMAFTSR